MDNLHIHSLAISMEYIMTSTYFILFFWKLPLDLNTKILGNFGEENHIAKLQTKMS